MSEKERAGTPAASKLTDIFEIKEDTEMAIFKKPSRGTRHDVGSGGGHPTAGGPSMMGVASHTAMPIRKRSEMRSRSDFLYPLGDIFCLLTLL